MENGYDGRAFVTVGKVVKPEFALVWDFKITYEMAKNWRKAHNAYLRQNQWKDLTVIVCLDVG